MIRAETKLAVAWAREPGTETARADSDGGHGVIVAPSWLVAVLGAAIVLLGSTYFVWGRRRARARNEGASR